MCLGIPGQVVRMLEGYGDQLALVDVAGEHRKVNVGMLPEETFGPGDWVIIHMGFVVEKTDKAGADEAMEGLELMGRGRGHPRRPMTGTAPVTCLRARGGPRSGLPAVRLHHGRRARIGRVRTQRHLRRRHRGRGRSPQISTTSSLDCATSPPPLAVIESIDTQDIPPPAAPASPSPTPRDPTAAARWPPATSRCAQTAPPNNATHPTGATATLRQLHQLRPALHDHRLTPLRPRLHHDGGLRDVRRLRPRIHRPRRPPVPCPTGLLPELRTARCATATGRRHDRRRRCTARGTAAAARRRHPGGQGHRRIPPGLRRRRRARGHRAAKAKAARRQAVRRDGARPADRARHRRRR